MNKMLLTILLLVLAAYGQQKVAIINTVDDEEPPIKISELNHLTDRLREIANKTLPQKSYAVMTQQSIQSLYPSNEDMIRACSGAEGCLVKIGREIAADYICQGRIGRFGKNYTIKVELYESMSGNLVSSFTGSAKDIYGLLAILNAKAPEAFKKIIPKSAQEVCKDDGNTWVNGECKTAAELADECEFAGKVWEKNACRAKTKREVCEGAGNIWVGGVCKTIAGLVNECESKSRIWENDVCRAKTKQEVCEGGGKVWENGVCKAPASGGVQGNVLTDARDGKKYRIVKIGSQVWMAENLNYGNIGFCFNNELKNCKYYGQLYSWVDAMKACPKGWRLPSNDEWETLVRFVGGSNAGKQLKAKSGWEWNIIDNISGNGTDDFNFSALPGGSGSRHFVSVIGGGGNWWTATASKHNNKVALFRYINCCLSEVFKIEVEKTELFSVRCVME